MQIAFAPRLAARTPWMSLNRMAFRFEPEPSLDRPHVGQIVFTRKGPIR